METIGQRMTFSERVSRLVERVIYRRADTPELKAEIYRMRHEAYTREGVITPRPLGLFSDAADEDPNVWLIAAYIDGELASSIRLHVSASVDAPLPARLVFADVVDPYLRDGNCLLDLSRHVNKMEFSRKYPEMPYITLRSAFLAEEYFGVDYILGAMRVEHAGAFKRMFTVKQWCGPREYPLLGKMMPLLTYDCRAWREKTHARYPFYVSTPEERTRLFEHSSTSNEDAKRMIRPHQFAITS